MAEAQRRLKCVLPWLAALASGGMLWSAYPPRQEPEMAWVALVPLLIVARFVHPRRGFQFGLAAGLAFWLPSIAWLWRLMDNGGPWPLVVLGHAALSIYCALYIGVFGALASHLWGAGRKSCSPDGPACPGPWVDFRKALLASAAWVGLEWLRSTVLTGFAWNHLGVSQVPNRAMLQTASLGGVYAVSALVLLLNATLASVAVRIFVTVRGHIRPQRHWDLMATLSIVVAAFLWGGREIRLWEGRSFGGPVLTVAAVQPNAPSIFERDDHSAWDVVERLQDRTARVALFRPDVIVWPETVLFGVVPQDEDTMAFAFETARRAGAPLLAGAVEMQERAGQRPLVANVSWMFQPDGTVSDRYRKEHLVPFGEFIPMDRWFPWLERLSPIGDSCTPGNRRVLMRVPMRAGMTVTSDLDSAQEVAPGGHEAVLSPLICFEDTVAPLARRAVRHGATVLVNQSNDAWFAGSSEAEQHHAQAVLRAVENRTPLVRCSNAGISTVVDPTGLGEANADYFVLPVVPRDASWPMTPYTRWGDLLFAIPCTALLFGLLVRMVRSRKLSPSDDGQADMAAEARAEA